MRCYNILFKLINRFLILIVATGIAVPAFGSIQDDIEQLRSLRKQAQELMNTNKNSQALELFERAGKIQERIYNYERDSVLKALNAGFVKNQNVRADEISKKEIEITELKAGNEDIDRENFKMIRNTLFFFGSLLGVAVLLLLNRFRRLAGLKEQLISSDAQVVERNRIIDTIEQQSKSVWDFKNEWNEINAGLKIANPLILKLSNDKQHPLHKTALQLSTSNQSCLSLLDAEVKGNESERILLDLNQVIEEVVSQAYFHTTLEHPDFKCAIVKDLEKILPKIELVPDDIRFVLFNLLNNAFYSVREKRSNAPKGYEPKVTISTRKLPRFVQVRVRDNGTGILEKEPTKIFEPFYSTKKTTKNAGLGLSESKRIITGIYKGELLTESDLSTGTDFIIRFPTLTIM